MPRDALRQLESHVQQLLFAGATAVTGDAALRELQVVVTEYARRAPALGRLAEQITRVLAARSHDAGRELLTLAVLVKRVRGAQAAPEGSDGAFEALAAGSPVETPLSAGEVEALHRLLVRQRGDTRAEPLREAARGPAATDLRLLDAWISLLDEPTIGAIVLREVVPRWGALASAHLRDQIALDGGEADGQRLAAVVAVEGVAARPLVELALDRGSGPVRAAALTALGSIDHPAAMARAEAVARVDASWEVRAVATRIVGDRTDDNALTLLLAAIDDRAQPVVDAAVSALQRMENPAVTARVARRVTEPTTEALGTADVRRLVRGLSILARRGGVEAVEAARALREHPTRVVREAAHEALITLRDTEALKELVAGLNGIDRLQRLSAVRAAFALSAAECFDILGPHVTLLAAAADADTRVGEVFEHLLYGAGVATADPRWATIAFDLLPRRHAEGWAIEYLAAARPPGTVAAFVTRLVAPEADFPSLLDALAELGDRAATGAVVALLGAANVPTWWVLHALERLDDPAAAEALRAFGVARGGDVEEARQVESLVARLTRDRTLDGA